MISLDFFKGKRVTVFGLGLNSGAVGTVDFLVKNGVREVIVTDIKTKEDLAPSLLKLSKYKNVTTILGQHRPEDFSHVDMVIKNPLIPWTNEYIKLAEKNNVPVEMDSSLFFALVPKVPIIGITGTKGKTTTATLLAHILEKAEVKVVRVGIGQVSVLGRFDQVTKESVVVFELSSWRLSALHRIKKSPMFSIVTNLYPDHLNYYKTLESYAYDKEAIFAYQKENDRAIFNADNAGSKALSEKALAQKYFFSETHSSGEGAFLKDGNIVFSLEGREEIAFSYGEVKLVGQHNRGNVLAAALAAKLFGLSHEVIRKGVASFSGVEHRLESVSTLKGVTYVNDSAATIPDAAIAALESISSPIILLAGGSDKKLSFERFTEVMLQRAKEIVLFRGEATEKILSLVKKSLPEKEIMVVDSMEKAVHAAERLARPGDTVLLSPGATSFGLFKNEFDRGEQFKAAVKLLAE